MKKVAVALLALLWAVPASAQAIYIPPNSAHLASNAALAASSTAAYPSGVWRDDYASGNGASPLWFKPLTGTCVANGLTNDGGSCVNAADGNSWQSVPQGSGLDVREFGAKCDYSVGSGLGSDDTTAINAGGTWLRANGYGRLYSPPQRYCYITGTVNLTSLNTQTGSAWAYRTEVALHLVCRNPGGTCIDAIGSKHTVFSGLELLTPHIATQCVSGDDAAIGIQYGRPNPTQTASQIDFVSPYIVGCFSKTAEYNFASEVTKHFGGVVDNFSTTIGAHNVRVDCDNHFNDLASSFVTISWTSGTFASCNDISYHGTTSQREGTQTLSASSSSGQTITFGSSVPASIAVGMTASDVTTPASIPYGVTVTQISGNTVTVSGFGGLSVSSNDVIQFAPPDSAVWIDGVTGFSWDGNGYISTGGLYGLTVYYESAHPSSFLRLPVHVEAYPTLIADVLFSGSNGATPAIFGFQREDFNEESGFATAVPDFKNGVNTLSINQANWLFQVSSLTASTWRDFGVYSDVTAASVVSGGSGCTTGAQTFTVAGGTGTAATISGTVSGGALSGTLTISNAGAYQDRPSSSSSTLTGGGCSVAPTVSLTIGTLSSQTPISFASGKVTLATGTNHSSPVNVYGLETHLDQNTNASTRFLSSNIYMPSTSSAVSGTSPLCVGSGGQLFHSTTSSCP